MRDQISFLRSTKAVATDIRFLIPLAVSLTSVQQARKAAYILAPGRSRTFAGLPWREVSIFRTIRPNPWRLLLSPFLAKTSPFWKKRAMRRV